MLTLILLPGMDGSGLLFSGFAAQFESEFFIKCVSYSPVVPLSYNQLVDDVCSQIPDEGELVILGESFSVPIAVMVAHRYSWRVKALILCCTFIKNPRPELLMFRFLKKCVSFDIVPKSVIRYLLFGTFGSQDLYAALDQALLPLSNLVFRMRLSEILDVDVTAHLSQLTMPILYLQATHDVLVFRSAFRKILHHKQHVNLVTFNAPHCLLQVLPVESALAVKKFISNIGYTDER